MDRDLRISVLMTNCEKGTAVITEIHQCLRREQEGNITVSPDENVVISVFSLNEIALELNERF